MQGAGGVGRRGRLTGAVDLKTTACAGQSKGRRTRAHLAALEVDPVQDFFEELRVGHRALQVARSAAVVTAAAPAVAPAAAAAAAAAARLAIGPPRSTVAAGRTRWRGGRKCAECAHREGHRGGAGASRHGACRRLRWPLMVAPAPWTSESALWLHCLALWLAFAARAVLSTPPGIDGFISVPIGLSMSAVRQISEIFGVIRSTSAGTCHCSYDFYCDCFISCTCRCITWIVRF